VEVAASAQQAYLPPDVTAPCEFVPSHDITEMECPSISNCNAEDEDEKGTTERDPEKLSESNATKKTQLR
jgi:hypothetical protein